MFWANSRLVNGAQERGNTATLASRWREDSLQLWVGLTLCCSAILGTPALLAVLGGLEEGRRSIKNDSSPSVTSSGKVLYFVTAGNRTAAGIPQERNYGDPKRPCPLTTPAELQINKGRMGT
ncbi:hypothetical protein NDU88_004783 [Pleurodeles waltl]|uniref:Uncharacterized protein n=1 Tax=Pleurodeles waltl TaxID=8319 RepID=A0AAV7T9H0_PLEWA|nr:hypothetical protein NDU88_004783 [Pleurodeles waltl]